MYENKTHKKKEIKKKKKKVNNKRKGREVNHLLGFIQKRESSAAVFQKKFFVKHVVNESIVGFGFLLPKSENKFK